MGVAAGLSLAACTNTENINGNIEGTLSAAGAIAVAYNNSDCELKLTQDQLSGIFLGTIKNYSELGCDPKAIKIVHRSDGSGTTYNFTKHLSAISPEWKDNVGANKSVQWPSGIGAKGNEGVSAQWR